MTETEIIEWPTLDDLRRRQALIGSTVMVDTISVLFAHRESNYKQIAGVDVWCADRDATQWPGGNPIVAHPPCRGWSQLSPFANPRPGEKDYALWAVEQVRKWGGVLEHPAKSKLWPVAKLPLPGQGDEWGVTIQVPQWWWGHQCEKMTWLYICHNDCLPPMPVRRGEATHVQSYSHRCRRRPQMKHSLREHTPPEMATWLVQTALGCVVST